MLEVNHEMKRNKSLIRDNAQLDNQMELIDYRTVQLKKNHSLLVESGQLIE